jgi:hypothetical protein
VITEKQWQAMVIDLATLYGWVHFHVFDSRRTDPGWPDLVLARVPQLLVAELKTDRGRLARAQEDWLELLRACGVETHVWRPRDLQAVVARLSRR